MNTIPFELEATPADLVERVRALLGASRNLAAVELARAGLAAHQGSAELTYLYALGCLRSGALASAETAISRLRSPGAGDSDIGRELRADIESLAGRLAKERFLAARSPTDRSQALRAAIDAYRCADALWPNVHARINAASLLRLGGEKAESQRLARSILGSVSAISAQTDHWASATRAEAFLLLDDMAGATACYHAASQLAGDRFGDLASMRRQLAMLAAEIPHVPVALAQLPGPKVVAFSGHMIDTSDRQFPRFAPSLEGAVRDAIDQLVAASCPIIAYTQAACGSDILFCESLLARSQEVNIVLPFSVADYIEQSVLPGGASWVARFERVMAGATSVTYATQERYLGDDTLFEHASNLIQGLAFLRAQELVVEPRMLVVADGSQAGGLGGTLATRSSWSNQSIRVEVIDLAALRANADPTQAMADTDLQPRVRAASQRIVGGGRTIKSLLFADVAGFSRLGEESFPAFFTAFLGLVPKTLSELGVEPLEISSRGDGLYAVFEQPDDAANFALTLSAAVGALNWGAMGLPVDTHIRIALHAGPVFTATDPVTQKWAHYGSHVTRAARVEPIVIPGQVLVTEAFAAVLAARTSSPFACDFVGKELLAKAYGTARLYRLRRKP